MTLREHLFSLPDKELADYLITTVSEPEYDYDYDENMYYAGDTTWFQTTDGQQFWYNEYEEAIEHQIKLLNSEYTEGETDEN